MPSYGSRSGSPAGFALAMLVCVAIAGCGGSAARQRPAAPLVAVNERDFHIEAPSVLKAGDYRLRIHNEGATDHELIVARDEAGALPLRPDGLTVDEEAIESREAGSLEPGAPGAVRYLTVHLSPGRYTFFCNMEGHYMAGMHHEVVVY